MKEPTQELHWGGLSCLQMKSLIFVLRSLPTFRACTRRIHQPLRSAEGRLILFDLQDKSTRVANGLRAADIKAGDRITVLDKNSDRFFEIWLGAAKLNTVIVPINARLAGPEISMSNDAYQGAVYR